MPKPKDAVDPRDAVMEATIAELRARRARYEAEELLEAALTLEDQERVVKP